MLGDRRRQAGHVPPAPQQPPTETREGATEHGTDRAPQRAAAADAGQQGAEGVVVGEMFDRVQQPRWSRHPRSRPAVPSPKRHTRSQRCAASPEESILCAMEVPRFLFVHAHPDDETLTTGATIAHYAARGARVQVVTCTLGEEGEVIGERWSRLAVDHADQLGGYRIGELSAALRELGVAEPTFLGGAGRWRDSGMAGTAPRGRQRFVDAEPREAVGALVAIIRELRPHVVVSYDPNGGYGHPDHIHANEVTTAAVAAAGGSPTTRASRGRCRSSTGPCRPAARWQAGFGELSETALPGGLEAVARVRVRVRLRRRQDRRRRRRTRESGGQGRRTPGPRDPGQRGTHRPRMCAVQLRGATRSPRPSTTSSPRVRPANATTAAGRPISSRA